MRIRERLTLQFTILVSALFLISALILYFFTERTAENYFDDRLKARAQTTFSQWMNIAQRDSSEMKLIDINRTSRLPAEKTMIVSETGIKFYNSNDTVVIPDIAGKIRLFENSELISFTSDTHRFIGLNITSESGESFIVFSGARPDEKITWLLQLRFLLVSIFVMMLAIIALTGWVFASRALKPLKKTIKEVQAIPATDFKHRLGGIESVDEIGELVRIINDLLSRIENSVNLQKTFVANVSHEIKNPITKIISQIEVTLLRDREPDIYKETLQSVLDDVREMSLLTQSLLDLTLVRHDPSSYNFVPVRIDEILWEVRDRIHGLPAGYRVDFAILPVPEDEQEMTISGNPYLLRTAFQNLIENAGKYSFDKFVDVRMNCALNCIEVTITNHGPGIREGDLKNIFEFGIRVDKIKSTKGYGIGLPLADRIFKIHNAKIKMESDPGIITKVTVTFDF
ncbi:MAG: HAMP domain-containing sensor histidine kinase [Cyclobacteriaceae bacterium]